MNEVLFAIGAGTETAGVCSPADYPAGAAALPVVASYENVDSEGIIASGVSACFIIEGMQGQPQLEALQRASIPVYSYRMDTLSDLFDCIADVGIKTGHAAKAKEVAESMRLRIAACAPPPQWPLARAVVVVNAEPLVAAGQGSFLGGLLRSAGFLNAIASRGEAYPVVSLETIASSRPQYLIFPSGDVSHDAAMNMAAKLNRILGTPCKVIEIPADLLVRPGPRSADAAEALARARGCKT